MTDLPYARLSSFYLVYFAAVGAFVPYWSLYLDARGVAPAAIGALMGIWYATRIFAPSLWGLIVARSRRPAHWLRIGCIATFFATTPFLLPLSPTAVALAMVVFCAFFNAVLPQFESLTLSHLVGRSERYGAIRVWGSFGFIAVVAALGAVFEHLPASALPWLMLPLFALIAFTSFLNDYGPAPAVESGEAGFLALVMRREVRVFLLVVFLMQISFGPYNTFFSLYLKQNEYRPVMLGVFWAIGVLVEIAVFAFAAPLLRRIPARRMIVLALVLAALRWTLTALAPRNIALMVLVQLSHAVVFGGFYAAYMQLLAEYFPGRAAGHGQALFTGLSSGAGGVLGALIAGFAWHAQGGQLAFLIGSAAAAVGALVAAREFGRTTPARTETR